MSDINCKLQEILTNIPYDHQVTFEAYDEAIAQIKALFADEGYVTGILTEAEQGYMTGAEWYARFEEKLIPYTHRLDHGTNELAVSQALEAAKKAAGL